MAVLLVGIGGFFGSLTRFSLGKYVSQHFHSKIPIGTAFINVTGALLLGILSGSKLNTNFYLLLGDGFLGAYTTFSTFMYEGFNLFNEKEKLNAFTYIFISLILGVLGYMLGYKIAYLM